MERVEKFECKCVMYEYGEILRTGNFFLNYVERTRYLVLHTKYILSHAQNINFPPKNCACLKYSYTTVYDKTFHIKLYFKYSTIYDNFSHKIKFLKKKVLCTT